MGLNTGLIVALGVRLIPRVGVPAWVALSSAGMIAALFGTPIAAALVLSEIAMGDPRVPLWDRLFLPLVAAGAGAMTTSLLGGASFAIQVAPYSGPSLGHVPASMLVAALGTGVGFAAVLLFPLSHRLFHRIKNPLLMATLGGITLGILGILGGQLTLFKGLEQMQELSLLAPQLGAGAIAWMAVVKLLALVVAGTSGFRGGRIFPSVFIGVALGLAVNAAVPIVPQALAVSCAVLGVLVAVTRQGWLSLFVAAVVVPDPTLLPVLVVAILPAWLLATGRPIMLVPGPAEAAPAAPTPAAAQA
jgi:H+/Cl- antiporter ClcA